MTSLKTSIKTITYLSDIGCLEIQGASLKALRSAQGQPEYAFNDQHSRDGKVRIALRSAS